MAYDSYTKLMLHMNGADASTTFTDEIGHTFTARGNAQLDTAQKKFGTASGLFDGTGDWIDTPDHADFTVDSGEFTIDFWIRLNAKDIEQRLFGQMNNVGTASTISFFGYIFSTNLIRFYVYSGATAYSAISTGTLTTNTWYHIAMVRDNTGTDTLRIFINGSADGTANVDGVIVNNSTNKLSIGRHGEYAANYVNGWIDEFRLSVGIARWTANFTPPTEEYGPPTVTTQDATDVTGNSCTGNGNITAIGTANATRRGFCYKVGTSGDPTTADSVAYDDGTFGTGAYTKSITGLSPDTGYRVRAYAVGPDGTGYGDTVQVTTIGTPVLTTTTPATSIEATTATCAGVITWAGTNCTKKGICWSTSSNPTVADSHAEHTGTYSDSEPISEDLTSLSTGTTYHFRAYAYNDDGYGYGEDRTLLTKPAAPTNVAATDDTYSTKVTITWTKSTGATDYHVWRDTTDLGAAGDVATYDDTGAGAPTITPGTPSASDGTNSSYVTLTLSGHSASNGTTHTYKVVASNATGNSADSATDTGYRGTTTLTYQWWRSAADSDADYSSLSGATTNPYNDTTAPSNGDGRYYKCVVSMSGATPQTSTADRGNRTIPPQHPLSAGSWYLTQYPDRNSIYLIGKDRDENLIFGIDANSTYQTAEGTWLEYLIQQGIQTQDNVETLASAVKDKLRLLTQAGEIISSPNCFQELWDVVSVKDTRRFPATTGFTYRISGIRINYDFALGEFSQTLQLTQV